MQCASNLTSSRTSFRVYVMQELPIRKRKIFFSFRDARTMTHRVDKSLPLLSRQQNRTRLHVLHFRFRYIFLYDTYNFICKWSDFSLKHPPMNVLVSHSFNSLLTFFFVCCSMEGKKFNFAVCFRTYVIAQSKQVQVFF